MRKIALFGLLVMLFVLAACGSTKEAASSGNDDNVLRIGYQKNGPLVLLQIAGELEDRLAELGFTLEWHEFQAGPHLVEALHAGAIDFGRTGNTPVIFAQAAETDFVYVAAGFSKSAGSGILVPDDSEIEALEDLEGKTIGFSKGSSSHYLLIKALEKAGLTIDDMTPAYLTPGDARIAFEKGTIDAMVVWDPYVASTELHSNGRLLVDGEGLTTDRDFFVATRDFYENHPAILEVIIDEIDVLSKWANENEEELVQSLAPLLGIDEASIRKAVQRRTYGIEMLTEEMMEEQQEIADNFFELEIIPKKIDMKDVME